MDALVTVLQPIETVQSLPNSCYTDPTIFQIEKKQLFASDWAVIGFGFDVPVPGCVCPVNSLGIPLVVERGRSDKFKVFENVCRHRRMILVEETKQLSGPITCQFHT